MSIYYVLTRNSSEESQNLHSGSRATRAYARRDRQIKESFFGEKQKRTRKKGPESPKEADVKFQNSL